jgi:hypothetical protein
MPLIVQLSQSDVCWEGGDEEKKVKKKRQLQSTPVKIVKRLSLSPGIAITIDDDEDSSSDLRISRSIESTQPLTQQQIKNDDSFESLLSQDFEMTEEQLLEAIKKAGKDDEEESYDVSSQEFEMTEEQILRVVKSVDEEQLKLLKTANIE